MQKALSGTRMANLDEVSEGVQWVHSNFDLL